MESMDSVFNTAGTADPTTNVVDNARGNDEKKAKINKMKQALKDTINSNPNYTEIKNRLSGSLKVVHTLGYGKGGNLIVDKSQADRTLKAVPMIVGYEVQNIGTEAIPYQTEKWALDEATGKYVGTKTEAVIEPGATAYLSRQYMTMLCASPEFSFKLANGKMVESSRKTVKDLKGELEKHYFSFNKDEGLEVNDESVKVSIDVDGVVKPEFVEDFGFFNNPKESKAGKSTKSNAAFTTQDLAANYIYRMLNSQNM